MKKIIALCLALASLCASATDWFVRPSEGTYGISNGTSYANAFDGSSDIVWASIAAGDTLWYCGTWNNTEGHGPGAAGTASSWISVRGDGYLYGKCGTETSQASIRRTSAGVFPFTIGGGDNYIIIKGFLFAGSSQGTPDYSALLRIETTAAALTDVIVEGNVFDGSTDDVLGILMSGENRTFDATNVTIRGNTFRNFTVNTTLRDAIRIVPKTTDGSQNGNTACVASVGNPVNLVISGNTFDNAKTGVRMQNLESTAADVLSCMDGRAVGLIVEDNTFTNMREVAVNLDCQAGSLCTLRRNQIGVVGTGTYDKANAIQTGKADGIIIEDNVVEGIVNDGSSGDGVGIILDHAVTFRQSAGTTLQTQAPIVRRNVVKNADSNPEACGISVWSADDALVYDNIIIDSTNGICMTGDGVGGTTIDDNANAKFYNNVIVNSVDEGFEISRASLAHEFINNIIVGGQWAVNIETGSTAPTDAANLYFGYTTAQVGGTGSYTPASSTVVANPRFVGGTALEQPLDFRLSARSPAIGAGVCYLSGTCAYKDFLNRRHRRPPNIGAFASGFGDQR